MHGQGTYTTKKGDIFKGNFLTGVKCNKGVEIYHDGGKYTGSFWNGERYGEGILTYEDLKYKGNWTNGHRMEYGEEV